MAELAQMELAAGTPCQRTLDSYLPANRTVKPARLSQ
jgi:hypothetical protein